MKNSIISFFLGMTVLALGYQTYVNYQLQGSMDNIVSAYSNDHQTITNIVNFINQAQKPVTK